MSLPALNYREMTAVLHMVLLYANSENKTKSENDGYVHPTAVRAAPCPQAGSRKMLQTYQVVNIVFLRDFSEIGCEIMLTCVMGLCPTFDCQPFFCSPDIPGPRFFLAAWGGWDPGYLAKQNRKHPGN